MDSSELSQREDGQQARDWSVYVPSDGPPIPRTWGNVQRGLIPWEDLDDEELGRGKLRDKNGGWSGRGPNSLPREMVAEVTRRLKDRYDANIRRHLTALQKVHFDIAMDPNAPPADRLRASAYMQERLIGKVPDKVEVVAEVKPWEGLVEGVLQDLPAEAESEGT